MENQGSKQSQAFLQPSMLLFISLLQTARGLNKVFIISPYRMQHANLKSLKTESNSWFGFDWPNLLIRFLTHYT